MEGAVRRSNGDRVGGRCRLGGGEPDVGRSDGTEVVGIIPGQRPAGQVVLDERPEVVDLLEIVEVELGHAVAAVRDIGDVALGLEHPQGLTHRDPADPQGRGEVLLAHGGSRRDVAAEDPRAHLDEHRLLCGRRALELRHRSTPRAGSGEPFGSRPACGTG